MITAREAKELTEKAIEAEVATRKARAEEFCEEQTNAIKQVCEARGNLYVVENIPQGLRAYVIDFFKSYGYNTKELNYTTIQLMW